MLLYKRIVQQLDGSIHKRTADHHNVADSWSFSSSLCSHRASAYEGFQTGRMPQNSTDEHMILALCDYRGCEPGDLLARVEVEQSPEIENPTTIRLRNVRSGAFGRAKRELHTSALTT